MQRRQAVFSFFCTRLDALGLRGLVLLVQAEVAELEHLLVRLPLEEEAQLLADRLHRLRNGDQMSQSQRSTIEYKHLKKGKLMLE